MNQSDKALNVPYLPSDAPFNDEQKQWLGGFLAGLHTRLLVKEEGVVGATAASTAEVKALTIIYGSQTGNSQAVAEDVAEQAKEHGMKASVIDMDDADIAQLASVERLLVVTSTYGEGDMPDNAESLWEAASADDAPSFANTYFSVLSLGDTNYDDFCLAGINWDNRLAELGGQRIADRVDCDVDFAEPTSQWISTVLPTIAKKGSASASSSASTKAADSSSKKAKSQYNKQNPLEAELITKKVLTQPDSSKQVYHYEFSLTGSGESYEAGDALNIIPSNRPDLVEELLAALGVDGQQQESYNGEKLKLSEIFTHYLEIRTPSKDFIKQLAARAGDKALNDLVAGGKDVLNDFLWAKDIVDLLKLYPSAKFSMIEFIGFLKPLAPRAYSISSSIKQHNDEVHLTIGNVRYNSNDREHNGVCSTFLADIAEVGDKVKCFFAPNKNFAVPTDPEAPMVMVGPGTGIAPFRAFLEERAATGATGDNWLFFGDRNSATDYLYQDEIKAMQDSAVLNRLDVAFSRDQAEKVYVQDRMQENAAELFAWLERGGYFFVCGDAFFMAKDVDKALHSIIEQQGNLSASEAEAYVNKLKKDKRYVRDVY